MKLELDNFIEQMNSSTSSNDKVEIIRHCSPLVRKVLYYTYNKMMQFNITPKVLEKQSNLCNQYTRFESIFELLNSLNQKRITGNKAIEEVNGFLFKNPELKEIF